MAKQPSELGALILVALEKKGMNQTDLARQLDITRPHISQVIWGGARASKKLFFGVMDVLELDQTEALRAFFGAELWDSFIAETAEDVH